MIRYILATVGAVAVVMAGVGTAVATNNPGGGHEPVTLCHKPDGNPVTITVDNESVLQAHLAHGDTLGPCPTETETTPTETTPTTPTETTPTTPTPTTPDTTPTTPRCPPGMVPTAGKDGEPGNDECEYPDTTTVKTTEPVICIPTTVEVVRTVTVPGPTKVVTKVKTKVKWKTKYIIKTRTIVKTKIVYVKGVHKNGVEANG